MYRRGLIRTSSMRESTGLLGPLYDCTGFSVAVGTVGTDFQLGLAWLGLLPCPILSVIQSHSDSVLVHGLPWIWVICFSGTLAQPLGIALHAPLRVCIPTVLF